MPDVDEDPADVSNDPFPWLSAHIGNGLQGKRVRIRPETTTGEAQADAGLQHVLQGLVVSFETENTQETGEPLYQLVVVFPDLLESRCYDMQALHWHGARGSDAYVLPHLPHKDQERAWTIEELPEQSLPEQRVEAAIANARRAFLGGCKAGKQVVREQGMSHLRDRKVTDASNRFLVPSWNTVHAVPRLQVHARFPSDGAADWYAGTVTAVDTKAQTFHVKFDAEGEEDEDWELSDIWRLRGTEDTDEERRASVSEPSAGPEAMGKAAAAGSVVHDDGSVRVVAEPGGTCLQVDTGAPGASGGATVEAVQRGKHGVILRWVTPTVEGKRDADDTDAEAGAATTGGVHEQLEFIDARPAASVTVSQDAHGFAQVMMTHASVDPHA